VDIRVHIDRLVIDGLPLRPDQRPMMQAALEAELMDRLAASGPEPGMLVGGAIPRLPAGTIHLTPQPEAAALGRQIAGAIHTGLARD
jgi:hypothetical protein